MSAIRQRVDAHHHLWDVSRRAHPWMDGPWADPLRRAFAPEHLAPLAARHGIKATVVVQAVGSLDETRELLALAASSESIAGVVGWVDLAAPDVDETLGALREGSGGEKLVGVRHQVQDEPDPRWLLRPDVQRGLGAIGDAGLVYDLLIKSPQLSAAAEVVTQHPETTFVVDHLAKPDIAGRRWEPWASGLAELATSPNVTAKISGLVTEADWQHWTIDDLRPYVRHALDCFGAHRLMFGSDWPVCLLAADYSQVVSVLEALLPVSDQPAIFGETARRVYAF